MENMFNLIFVFAFIAGAIYIPYKIYKVIFVGEVPKGTSSNTPETDWKCPKCGLINNAIGGSRWCLCGYDKNKPQVERQKIEEPTKAQTKIINSPYEPTPQTFNNNDDFENLTQTALKSALFQKNYEVIGLRANATIDEVRERCKELVKEWHPDLHKHDLDKHRQATIKMQEIKAAYEAIISDSSRTTRTLPPQHNIAPNRGTTQVPSASDKYISSPPPKREPKSYAKAWPRFFARTFDLWWESLLVGFAAAIILTLINNNFAIWINKPGAEALFCMLILPIVLIFDAALYSLVGNTPGKMLLGFKVTRPGSIPLDFGEYCSRNMSLWFSGLALGFPLVNLFTMAYQHKRLGRGEPASYDYNANYKVQAKPLGGLQITAFVFLYICLFFVMGILKEIGKN